MPRAKISTKKSETISQVSSPFQDNPAKASVSRFPKFSFPKTISYAPIMVVLLVIAAFFLGMLLDKVQYLQKNSQNTVGSVVQNQQAPSQAGNQQPAQKQNVTLGHFPVKGNANAKVTIIEFADFRCPFCNQFFTSTENQLFKDYVDSGKVKFAFRQYAFLGPASNVAADAAECANDQGKFWEFHDYLYKNQPSEADTSMYNTNTLTQAAISLGINGDQFRSCLDGKQGDSKAQTDFSDGQKAGVSGTPTFFINGTPLVGAEPYSAFQQAIEAALKQS